MPRLILVGRQEEIASTLFARFFVFYSNIFTYGLLVDSEQPLCTTWQSAFDLILKLAKLQSHWEAREIECSSQTHTGHCVFQISPKRTGW
ncbi:hypothetical protein ccbrp13_25940 [Ktedonobacteria bacterium brp13]|nr:hypothetical protein ccbrp13_25940 [Ktedonobacteria bacterium brp13]